METNADQHQHLGITRRVMPCMASYIRIRTASAVSTDHVTARGALRALPSVVALDSSRALCNQDKEQSNKCGSMNAHAPLTLGCHRVAPDAKSHQLPIRAGTEPRALAYLMLYPEANDALTTQTTNARAITTHKPTRSPISEEFDECEHTNEDSADKCRRLGRCRK